MINTPFVLIIFFDLFLYSVDENFMPNSSCERISIVYEEHSYNICMSNRRIYIVKLLNFAPSARMGGGAGGATVNVAGNGVTSNAGVYLESDSNQGTTAVLT